MKEITIESVDDGCEGFLRTEIENKIISSDDHYIFFTNVLEALGYELEFVYIEEYE